MVIRAVAGLAQEPARYLRIAEVLAAQIDAGELPRGAKLLGERDLCKRFDVSRVTLRRALSELQRQGMIEADSARGWFVSFPHVGEPNALMGFSEMAASRGLKASSLVIRCDVLPATIDEADELRIAPGSEIVTVERVRRLDDVAVALERSRVPLRCAPDLPASDLSQGSLYEALRRAGSAPASAEYTLQAVAASGEEARLLGVAEGTPLLLATAVTHDRSGRPIELSRSAFRGDRYRFRTTLQRSRRDPA